MDNLKPNLHRKQEKETKSINLNSYHSHSFARTGYATPDHESHTWKQMRTGAESRVAVRATSWCFTSKPSR
ncbi:hypothetical protein YC2023_060898 [Brassica napus]